jgi:hypothetical protein
MIDLIYCANGNKRYAEIAKENKWLYGTQATKTFYLSPDFTDFDPKKPPTLKQYLDVIAREKPRFATVLDWDKNVGFNKVMEWAESIAPFVETVIIIPKIVNTVHMIPNNIGGKHVRLGYSVPTRHGLTLVLYHEFKGRDVHLLGGSPQSQLKLSNYLYVTSLDCNQHQLMASRYCSFFSPSKGREFGLNNYWVTIKEADGKKWGDGSKDSDANYEAFRRSCVNIRKMWENKDNLGGFFNGI